MKNTTDKELIRNKSKDFSNNKKLKDYSTINHIDIKNSPNNVQDINFDDELVRLKRKITLRNNQESTSPSSFEESNKLLKQNSNENHK